jgi:hypothetical protein
MRFNVGRRLVVVCTELYMALPTDADIDAIDALLVEKKVSRGMSGPWKVESLLRPDERMYQLKPWKQCYCGWTPFTFKWFVAEAINRRFASRVGVLAIWQDDDWSPVQRVDVLVEDFGEEDDEKILYVTKPPPPRPIVRRHGGRRKRRTH